MPAQTRVSDQPEVLAALATPTFTVPPVPPVPPVIPGGPLPGIGWLRGNVARFADGADHHRRRLQVTGMLAAIDVTGLRRQAARRTRAVLDAADGRPVDLMAEVARTVPVELLAAALGVSSVPAGSVATIARAYQPGTGVEGSADEAVAQLVEAFGGVADEATAARIALLVQACDATAGLVGNAALAMLRSGADVVAGVENTGSAGGAGCPVARIVAETLLCDPPVQITRRLATATGEIVILDLAASRLPFGAGPHECPGRDHAMAIATGIVESVRGCRLVEPAIGYEPSAALRVPARLVVAR